MIRTEALTKFYGSRCAVRDLSISIQDREIVGFLGLNGAGKTTALKMLAGVLAPSSGRIEIGGQDMVAAGTRDIRSRIGFLPDRPPLYDDMSVRGYLDFTAKLRGIEDAAVNRRVSQVLEMTALGEYADEPIASLSHGYRQRAGIAQAIVHDPELVILDEPTGGLDPVQIVEMRSLIRSLKSQHTVLLSSHNLPEISQSCDRLMVIKGGKLVWAGSEGDLSQKLRSSEEQAVELTGDPEAIRSTFERLKSSGVIQGFSKISPQEYHVEIGQTPPEQLSKGLVEAGHGLRRLQPVGHELEELFLELTRAAS